MISGPAGAIEGEGADGGVLPAPFFDGGEARLAKQGSERAGEAVGGGFEAVHQLHEQKFQAHRAVFRPAKVHNIERAAGPEHAPDFGERPPLVVAIEMVEEEARDNAIEAAVGKRKIKAHGLNEPHVLPAGGGLGPGNAQHFRVAIEPDDFGGGLALLEPEGQSRGAAAQVEHALARGDDRALKQPALEFLLAERAAHERIVERGEPPPSQRGDVLAVFWQWGAASAAASTSVCAPWLEGNFFPVAANHCLANLRRALALLRHLTDQENLLEAGGSTGGVLA